jgi:hypothetical protein
LSVADRRFDHVLDHRALQRISDHERRRGEIIGAHVRRDPASKLRLPEEDGAATRSLAWIAFEIGSGKGPELPMQVVQP